MRATQQGFYWRVNNGMTKSEAVSDVCPISGMVTAQARVQKCWGGVGGKRRTELVLNVN